MILSLPLQPFISLELKSVILGFYAQMQRNSFGNLSQMLEPE